MSSINKYNYVGLQNLGNTCYMNAALQIILNNNELVDYFINRNFQHQDLHNFRDFIIKYKSSTRCFAPLIPKKMVGEKYKLFGGFLQNDSHEFMILLFDILEEAMKKEYEVKHNNEIANLYDHRIMSTLKCKLKGCNFISTTKSFNRFLSLEIPDKKNLELDDCYREFKAKEKLEDDERWFCEKCEKKRIASKKLNIESWSKHLIIQLKRFKCGPRSITKNNNLINVPLIWRHNYSLSGFIIHSGGPRGGHYISVAQINSKWILFDDATASEISIKQVNKLASHAYILYYIINE